MARPEFKKKKAWWYLTLQQKSELQQFRLQGLYGGNTSGESPYFWVQSGVNMDAAEEADIDPVPVIETISGIFDRKALAVKNGVV